MKKMQGKKAYPLTAAQRLHFYSSSYCPKKQLLNIGTSLTIENELDWDALKKAVYQAYERCDSMRLRFTQDKNGTVYQYLAERETRDIEHFDFRHWKLEDAKRQMRTWTEAPLELFDSPMNRVVMIALPDGFNGIYLLVHHMTMDAQSLILFLRDIIEIYCNMMYEGIDYPKPMASYLEQLEKDLAYEAGNKAYLRDKAYFEKKIAESEPIFNDFVAPSRLLAEREELKNPNLRAGTLITDNVDANICVFHLEEDPSNRLMRFCEEYEVSMVCLLMMGLRTYFQKVNGNDDVSLNTTVARRATLLEKRCGGSRIHCFPFRTIVPEGVTFLEGLRIIRDGQNELFRHANYSSVDYFQTREKCYPSPRRGMTYEPMSLTYQPLTLKGKGLDRLGEIRYRSAWYSNGVAAQVLYLTVMHRAEDNGLDFNFEYQTGGASEEELEKFYYYLCRILFRGIESPEQTVGELIASV